MPVMLLIFKLISSIPSLKIFINLDFKCSLTCMLLENIVFAGYG